MIRGTAGIGWCPNLKKSAAIIGPVAGPLWPMAKASAGKGTVPFTMKSGHRYVTRIEFRKTEIRGYIDGELKIAMKTDYRDFGLGSPISTVTLPGWTWLNGGIRSWSTGPRSAK